MAAEEKNYLKGYTMQGSALAGGSAGELTFPAGGPGTQLVGATGTISFNADHHLLR